MGCKEPVFFGKSIEFETISVDPARPDLENFARSKGCPVKGLRVVRQFHLTEDWQRGNPLNLIRVMPA